MLRILMTGGSGLLGTSLVKLKPDNCAILATYNSEMASPSEDVEWAKLDLTDAAGTRAIIADFKPDVVLHAGSIGSVDFAEKNRELSHRTNVEGTRNIAQAAGEIGARVIFISSNAVFNGEHPPYRETDPVTPANYYGELKAEGERITLAAHDTNAVVRPILMYGWPNEGRRGNLVTMWLSKLEAGEKIIAVDDVWSKPLWVDDASRVCWDVIDRKANGTFNVCGSERVTLHQLAVQVAEVFGHDPGLITAVDSSYFGDIANRPKDTSFDITKIKTELGIEPLNVADGLAAMRDSRVP